jgi:hypothetical protein
MVMFPQALLSALTLLPWLIAAQDGSIDGPTSSAGAAGYSCDPSKCQLPNCNCASVNPPGGLQPVSCHFCSEALANEVISPGMRIWVGKLPSRASGFRSVCGSPLPS